MLPTMSADRRRRYLALDTSSPLVSVAVGARDAVLAEASVRQEQSSEGLLRLVGSTLDESGHRLEAIAGVCALRGPGSFTGVRVGLATVMGFHQALDLPATALSTLEVLAAAGARHLTVHGQPPSAGRCILAAVDALRDQWFVQSFRSSPAGLRRESEARLAHPQQVRDMAPTTLVAFGVEALAAAAGLEDRYLVAPPPLAGVAVRLVDSPRLAWDPGLLTRPLYLRPPPVGRLDAAGRRS